MDVYGLIGDPVDHSASPAVFNAAFAARDESAVYGTFRVGPGRLESALEGAAALDVKGVNVTIPYKEAAFELVEPTGKAQAIGAVNTLDFRTDPPVGDNTDRRALERVLPTVAPVPGSALLVGAGGAARAYAYALRAAGWHLTVANRTRERAEALAAARPTDDAIALDEADAVVPDVDLVVNATPVGLDRPEASPIDPSGIHADHVVIDAVYRPRWTRLARTARDHGATVVTGDELLLEQAVAAYERWRPAQPPVDAMRDALEHALA